MRRGEIREVVILYGEGCCVKPVAQGGGDVIVYVHAEDVVWYLDEGSGGEGGIYVYFLKFDPSDPDKARREREELARRAAPPAEGSGAVEEGGL